MTGPWPPAWWDGALAGEILQRSGEHLLLVGTAIGLALAISLPLGLWISRRPRWAGPVLAVASTVQTVPSLAIFGLLLTVPLLGGIGTTPAIVALTLYALLPLLRGLVTGLAQVPPGLKQAGQALGLSGRQVLLRVELPLALPTLMAGLRVATVISVGVATIAAAIGAGGLGVFIFRGIATVNNGLILAGALPAAAIALVADGGLGLLERRLAQPRAKGTAAGRRRPLRLAWLLAGLALGTVLALQLLPTANTGTVRIGSKSFTEQLILGELLAQQIEAATPLKVRRDFGLGGTGLIHAAVRSGRIDGYVEYTGTAWTTLLDQPPPPPDTPDPARQVFEETRRLYGERFGLSVFPSLGFENSFAILVRRDAARRLGIATISEAAPHTPTWRAGFGYEFLNRPDGFVGLAQRYGLRFAQPPEAMDLGLTYRALAEGRVDLIAGDTTNGLIPALDLQQLRDDRHYFPPYEAVPVFNAASLRRRPELVPVIEALAGQIPAATMQRLNAQVDLDGLGVEEVVRRWRLQQAGAEGAS
ncbi:MULTISPECIES: ABC transporter permease/substrate-binding protein [unclassified Cyanobium]|uniref:ABC transporter permease/substrate-binding protein n=1 Tax=unclassified Cyanobium TaxID=2627006 RepID=UPI0020CE3C7F|nr:MULTISPECIES: ABC transporter permease/substrate-binding protein [unclassified Cyanobium]MCP9834285.1 ABC transporter permease/substrate-binding protein [Cyanobium sp. La Preciosa 7G6]MCP9937079.1 ABC transporter permease/substrate-binding protein [Cyanobium sp. Aljojuca 7A6]